MLKIMLILSILLKLFFNTSIANFVASPGENCSTNLKTATFVNEMNKTILHIIFTSHHFNLCIEEMFLQHQ